MVNQDIVDGLRESMDAEFYTGMSAFQGVHNIKGSDYHVYGEYLHGFYKDGLKSFHAMADHLHGYLEEIRVPSISPSFIDNVEELFLSLYEMTVWAIRRYNKLSIIAENSGDVAMATFFQDTSLVKEEQRKDLVKLLGREPDMEDGD